MANFIISYDLNKSNKDYEGLINAIKSLSIGGCCCPCKSTWLVRTNHTSSGELYNQLRDHLDKDDYIVVANVDNNLFAYTDKETADFITKNFL